MNTTAFIAALKILGFSRNKTHGSGSIILSNININNVKSGLFISIISDQKNNNIHIEISRFFSPSITTCLNIEEAYSNIVERL